MDLFEIFEWPDKFRWMSFEARSFLSFLTIILFGFFVVCLIAFGVLLIAYGHGIYVGILIVVLLMVGIYRFCRGIYRDYRRAYPKVPKSTLLEKKKNLFTE